MRIPYKIAPTELASVERCFILILSHEASCARRWKSRQGSIGASPKGASWFMICIRIGIHRVGIPACLR